MKTLSSNSGEMYSVSQEKNGLTDIDFHNFQYIFSIVFEASAVM
jgi:hypothetical protein